MRKCFHDGVALNVVLLLLACPANGLNTQLLTQHQETRAGASAAVATDEGNRLRKGEQRPVTVFPGPSAVHYHAKDGNLPVKVASGSPLRLKLENALRVIQAVAQHDRSAPSASATDKSAAADRFTYAQLLLERLETHGDVRAVDVVEVARMAARSQTAESLRQNRALLTATDMSVFLVGFRGEDFGHESPDQGTQVTVQGDIMATRQDFRTDAATFATSPGRVWTDGHVYYCFATDTSQRTRRIFEAALEHYRSFAPFLRFDEVDLMSGTSSSDHPDRHECAAARAIIVTNDNRYGCFSHLGMVQRVTQQLNLQDPGCLLFGTVLHELGHALGMAHEHSRSEADYVYQQRIVSGTSEDFAIDDSPLSLETRMLGKAEVKRMVQVVHGGNVSALTQDSDPLSIMHFDPFMFEGLDNKMNGVPAIRHVDFERMGQRVGLSRNDVRHLVRLYARETGSVEMPATEATRCINSHDATVKDVCSSLDDFIPWCSSAARLHCCACGGGVQLQCFKGQPCPLTVLHTQARYWRCEALLLLASVLGSIVLFLRARGRALTMGQAKLIASSKTTHARDRPVADLPAQP